MIPTKMSGGGGGDGGGGGGLSKLGTALVIIFTMLSLAIFAQLLYALWRRRVFRRQTTTVGGGGGEDVSRNSSSDSTFSSITSSKELLYFFCMRGQFRLDRNSLTANSATIDANSNQQSNVEVVDFDMVKIQGMFGPPRFLFTIKEEEREDLDSPARKTLYQKEENKNIDDENRSAVISLEKYVQSEEDSVVVAVDIDDRAGIDDATPFSTPCASPSYFSPSASPVHEVAPPQGSSTTDVV